MILHLHVNDEPYSDFEITDDVSTTDYFLLFQCLKRILSDMVVLKGIESISLKRYHDKPPSNNHLQPDRGDSAGLPEPTTPEGDPALGDDSQPNPGG